MSTRKRPELIAALVAEMRQFIANAIVTNQQIADRLGINVTDQQTLNLLDLKGSATPGDLARLTGLTTGGVTVVLDRLEAAGFIRRERNPRDRRSVIVRPVAAKLRKVARHYETVNAQLDGLLTNYPAKDLETVLEFFGKTNRVEP